ncbi:hypothetical protein ABIB99_009014 [Bradyrhizobium sp. LA6.1]
MFNTMLAYSGKFKLSGDTFTTTVDISWVTEWLGTEQLRYVHLDGDILSLRTPVHEHPRHPGRRGFGDLRWRREKKLRHIPAPATAAHVRQGIVTTKLASVNRRPAAAAELLRL